MKAAQTYPIHSQTAAWLHCVGMSLRTGKLGFGFGIEAANMRPGSAIENLTKEASR